MKIKLDRWKIATIILAIISIVLAVLLSQTMLGSPQKAADKAIEYINKYLLSGGATATLVSVDNDKIGSLRKITIDVAGNKFGSYVSIDGKYLFASEPFDMTKDPNAEGSSNTQTGSTVETTDTQLDGSFSEAKDTEVCMENGKPIVYFFGSASCPHCVWEKPILKSVVDKFGDAVSYHENIDSETDIDVFNKYSTGSVPTLVIGCKYFRVGSGESAGEESEKASLQKIICLATGNQPASLCQ
ncbi:MAG: thioredoxin family protein [Candidatus Paceibacterota bacterium]|jgi:thiol-disulfide isomerase/thioredoxin